MATKNFTQFSTATPLTTGDYIVGHNAAGTTEVKATVKQIIDLVQVPQGPVFEFTWTTAPSASGDSGTAGQVAYAENYFYICVAPNTWKRSILAVW